MLYLLDGITILLHVSDISVFYVTYCKQRKIKNMAKFLFIKNWNIKIENLELVYTIPTLETFVWSVTGLILTVLLQIEYKKS
jgi:hypothetical protein